MIAYAGSPYAFTKDVVIAAKTPVRTGGAPDTILRKPYVVNNHMPEMAASAKSVLFGDFSKYLIRNVAGFTLVRLNEIYALRAQVGFVGFARYEGNLLDAGTNPIKYYANSAT